MLREVALTFRVGIPIKSLEKNNEVLASAVANRLLKQLSNVKACKYGYLLAVTRLISIGHGDNNFSSQHILFPVDICCRIFTPVDGEVMTGIVHKINDLGVFIRSGPMNMVYLSAQMMPNYRYVPGDNPTFVRDDSSKIEIDVVVRYMVFAVRWIEDRWREFRVLASIDADGLGPISLNGLDGIDLHFFFTAMLFVYGRILSQRLVNTVSTEKFLYKLVGRLIKYHMVTCYFLYIAGFMWFILTLKKKMYKYQFGQYAWTHMILIVVFTQSSFTVANIFEGIFWFLLPASLIVINDIAAYIFGFFFGKTPLIKLSPKKTWEGFIGASVATVVSAFVLANILGRFQWLTCPRKDLSTGWLQCDPGPLFKPEYFTVPDWFPGWFPWREFSILPVQWHALWLGLFASIIAPFGGFFASGFKRAFKIKDFGDSIPGHGGITDRMDCQMVMAVFAYIYHQSFIVPQSLSVEMIMDQILINLTFEEQRTLYTKLGQIIMERQFGES